MATLNTTATRTPRRRAGTSAARARRDASTAGLSPALRRRLEDAAETIIATLDMVDGDPDREPDHDGEAEPAEASAQLATLAPDRAPARRITRSGETARALPVLPASAAIGIPEIRQPNPNPLGHAPRVFRMVDDAMEPSVRRGDLLMAVPVSGYHCEGLYLLTFGEGHLAVYRCEARQGRVHAWKDNRARGFAELVLTPAEFREAVLAQVAITGRLIAGGLLPEVSEIVG